MKKKRILLFADWFDPAFKAGGPIRSCVNFVLSMQEVVDIYVYTSDRDLGETSTLPSIETSKWLKYGTSAQVFYATPSDLSWKNILALVQEVRPDYVYCNSLFSKYFTIYPLLYKRLNKFNGLVVLSPRGMLKPSALMFKSRKKKVFLSVLNMLRIPERIVFHATDKVEAECVQEQFGNQTTVIEVGNFPEFISDNDTMLPKETGKLKIVFVGRIHKIKNLLLLLKALQQVEGEVNLDIVGVKEDEAYWQECVDAIKKLPSAISANYLGERPHNEVHKIIRANHVFCLPTQGENFGHAIFESLAEGKPVIISDQTPWKNLETSRSGMDLPIDLKSFVEAIQTAVKWDQSQYVLWSKGAKDVAKKYVENSNLKEKYLALFS